MGKLPSWISVIGVVAANQGTPCAGPTENSCLTGLACSWNAEAGNCYVDPVKFTSQQAMAELMTVMKNLEPEATKSAQVSASDILGIFGLQFMQISDLFKG